MTNSTYKPPVQSVIDRSARISLLLPLLSQLRHASNTEARNTAYPLQNALRDLDRLNDIEMLCRQADDETGPTLWLRIIKILERP
jgi:hypothetical protein